MRVTAVTVDGDPVPTLPAPSDAGIDPGLGVASEPFYVTPDGEPGDVGDGESARTARSLAHAWTSVQLEVLEAGGDPDEVSPRSVSWRAPALSRRAGRSGGGRYEACFPGGRLFRIPVSRALRELESAMLGAPDDVCRRGCPYLHPIGPSTPRRTLAAADDLDGFWAAYVLPDDSDPRGTVDRITAARHVRRGRTGRSGACRVPRQ